MMSNPEFRHLRLNMAKDIVLVEVLTKDIRTPELGQELSAELSMVTAQEWAHRLVVDFRHTRYLSSTGLAALFKLVSEAKTAGRQVKICNMNPDVRIGADIVGLGRLVEIHDSEKAALKAFSQV